MQNSAFPITDDKRRMEQQANSGLLKHKWENAFTLDTTTWGYKRNSDINE